MIWKPALHFVLFLSIWLHGGTALFEDQAGKSDWRQQYVGQVKFVDFDQSGVSGKHIIIATEQNVLASLSTRNGHLGWRQVFEVGNTGRVDDMLQTASYGIVALGGGQYIRCFNINVGNLVWEVTPSITNSDNVAKLLEVDRDRVAALTGARVAVYRIDSGIEEWSVQLPNSNTVRYVNIAKSKDAIVAIGVTANSHVSVVSLNDDGVVGIQSSVPAAWISEDTSCQVAGSGDLVCVDPATQTLYSLTLTNPKTFKATMFQSLLLSGQGDSFVRLQKIETDEEHSSLLLRLAPDHLALLRVEKGAIKLVRDLKGVSAAQIASTGEDGIVLALARKDDETAELTGYDLVTGGEMTSLNYPVHLPVHHGLPVEMFGVAFKKKDGSLGFRFLIVSEDHSLILMQQPGKVVWLREEALASIVSVEMVDLPVSQIQAQMEEEFGSQDDILGMFVKRFSSQFTQLKEFVIQLKNKLRFPRHHHHVRVDEVETDEEDDDAEDEEEYLTRDEFSLHKMIVAVTAAGKIFGIDGPTGHIMWRQYYPNMVPFHRYKDDALPLLVQRTTAHFPHPPQCTVVGKHKVTGKGFVHTFNPISGHAVEGVPSGGRMLDYTILQMTLLQHMNDDFLRPVVFLDDKQQLHVYPESDTQLVKDLADSLYMFITDAKSGILTGLKMNKDLSSQQLWTVSLLQGGSQTISSVLPKRATEHVHSQGIVLGDRSVLYKYLNPNLVVVLTEGIDNTDKNFFNIYLIDAVSGNMVFHCTHRRTKGPISVIHSENWVVYTYWSSRHRRNEVTVLELYEGTKQSNATAFSSLNPPPAPLVMRQSYIFPSHVTSMSATITEKGITSKHILMAMSTGGLLELPKALMDPRRPVVPMPEHREEGLMPYIPELPRPFEATINYNQSVFNIRGIHTAPAGLESTCLVLAYGLDLFYTRVTPSKMFDVLKEDFDYLFISSVLGAMIAVSIIARKLSARKALNRAWK